MISEVVFIIQIHVCGSKIKQSNRVLFFSHYLKLEESLELHNLRPYKRSKPSWTAEKPTAICFYYTSGT